RIPLSSEERSHRNGDFPYYGASGIIDSVDDFIFDEDLVLVSEDGANLLNRSSPISFVATGRYWVNNHAHILKPSDKNLHYWAERIEAVDLVPFVTGSAQPKFTADALMNLKIAVPPTESERADIQTHFLSATERLDTLLAEAERAIELLQERRTALISAAVTGKIDVRQFAHQETA
ncbi:MAG: restriction endonuclease subunit S, partial [Planctomycetota bacterium]|nr:restriction endonuclease subunit S [Planctomycetota bacterium]